MISVYITFRDEPEARSIARHLLEKRLIACANIFPVKSMFWWQGKVTDEQEVAMLAKAPKRNFGRIKDEVRKLHSYEVPCIVSLPVEHKDEDFSKWVEGETQP
ncbi:divalent-cation tolerance protein CutA [Candidatus Woesearchaeota archaeon]|nr:divalent-cation tolerance protein CutA [Candidatus Woesearchaeota archaeon]